MIDPSWIDGLQLFLGRDIFRSEIPTIANPFVNQISAVESSALFVGFLGIHLDFGHEMSPATPQDYLNRINRISLTSFFFYIYSIYRVERIMNMGKMVRSYVYLTTGLVLQ